MDRQRPADAVADGFAKQRIAVFDANTGTFKGSWGAYGEKPADTDPGRTIRTPRRRSSSAR